jgi:hypothetical protein
MASYVPQICQMSCRCFLQLASWWARRSYGFLKVYLNAFEQGGKQTARWLRLQLSGSEFESIVCPHVPRPCDLMSRIAV